MAARRPGGRRAVPPDGASHDNTVRAQVRPARAAAASRCTRWYSTTEALAGGARDADAGAACVILEQFLRSLPEPRTVVGALTLDAEALYRELLRGVRNLRQPDTRLVGVTPAWRLPERLQQDLGLAGEPGVISSAMHRDDYASRGLAPPRPGWISTSTAPTS